MTKEQQINQINYPQHQNQQAYLLYCQQIAAYLHILNWLRAMYLTNELAIYNEKCTLSSKKNKSSQTPGKSTT